MSNDDEIPHLDLDLDWWYNTTDPNILLMQRAEQCYNLFSKNLENEQSYRLLSIEAGHEDGEDSPHEELKKKYNTDKEFTLAAMYIDGRNLEFAPLNFRNDEEVVLVACQGYGLAIKYASEEMKNNKRAVLEALASISSHPYEYEADEVLHFASPGMRHDKEVVLSAVAKKGVVLQLASQELKADKEVVLKAVSQDYRALVFASDDLKHDNEVVMASLLGQGREAYKCWENVLGSNTSYAFLDPISKGKRQLTLAAVYRDGHSLLYAPAQFQNDREIVLLACYKDPYALAGASQDLQSDKQVVLVACSKNGLTLQYASLGLKDNREIVLIACSQTGLALEFASEALRNDKEICLMACSQKGAALQYASEVVKNDREVVLTACSQDGNSLQYAPEPLRGDKEVVMAAVESKPESLKFALNGLNQEKACLVKAGLWDESYISGKMGAGSSKKVGKTNKTATPAEKRKIVLSTKFSLSEESSSHATRFALALKKHPYVANGDFLVYSPNAFNKGTCDPNWTDSNWPCRGTYESCRKPHKLKVGKPKEVECCWRYSFRYQLKDSSSSGGFMIQVVDKDNIRRSSRRRAGYLYKNHTLGDGQRIETEMASDEGTKIFRFFEPLPKWLSSSYEERVNQLVAEIKNWYRDDRHDMDDFNAVGRDHYDSSSGSGSGDDSSQSGSGSGSD